MSHDDKTRELVEDLFYNEACKVRSRIVFAADIQCVYSRWYEPLFVEKQQPIINVCVGPVGSMRDWLYHTVELA